jgi:hypothetical protein
MSDSARQTISVYTDTLLRLNELCDFFGLTQSSMIDEALASHRVLKGVSNEEILDKKLAILNGPTRRMSRRAAKRSK